MNFSTLTLRLFPLLLLLAFSTVNQQLVAQAYSIQYSDMAGDPLLKDDVNTCQDIDFINSVRAVIVDSGADNTSVTLSLPTGINYRAGSITVVSQMGGLSIVESNITDLNMPVFDITPADLNIGDEIVISWAREANCEAVDYQNEGNTFKDIVIISGDAGTVTEDDMELQSYDILVSALSIISHAPVTTVVGNTETVDLTITNGGLGCVEDFHFISQMRVVAQQQI